MKIVMPDISIQFTFQEIMQLKKMTGKLSNYDIKNIMGLPDLFLTDEYIKFNSDLYDLIHNCLV